MSQAQAIDLLIKAADELSQIHRAKYYLMWRSDNLRSLGEALLATTPFAPLSSLAIFSEEGLPEDAQTSNAAYRIGDWVIDQLLSKTPPSTILARLDEELARDRTCYSDTRVIIDTVIDAPCMLGPSLAVVPTQPFLTMLMGDKDTPGLAQVRQDFTQTPAFVASDAAAHTPSATQTPSAETRAEALPVLRYACLLASDGPIAFRPLKIERNRSDLFTPPRLNETVDHTQAEPSARQILAADLQALHAGLVRFDAKDSLYRAVERLGRARRAQDPVDQALELGIAAEIAMTHGDQGGAEITYRLSTRLAWLLGKTPEERQSVFADAKALYGARSKAVHEGRLSSRSRPDLAAGDRLVTRALRALVQRGSFPDWTKLTMGAD